MNYLKKLMKVENKNLHITQEKQFQWYNHLQQMDIKRLPLQVSNRFLIRKESIVNPRKLGNRILTYHWHKS